MIYHGFTGTRKKVCDLNGRRIANDRFESIADVEFSLNWKSGDASHREVCFRRINFWRDIMPEDLYSMFMGSFEGIALKPGFVRVSLSLCIISTAK